ncbi:MAG: hypothetical protein DRP56_05130 [Planctomycetota bacterium]|nr:MAG: hypothetical protein DRP56_05130 [Planctomycetota bacterium]
MPEAKEVKKASDLKINFQVQIDLVCLAQPQSRAANLEDPNEHWMEFCRQCRARGISVVMTYTEPGGLPEPPQIPAIIERIQRNLQEWIKRNRIPIDGVKLVL